MQPADHLDLCSADAAELTSRYGMTGLYYLLAYTNAILFPPFITCIYLHAMMGQLTSHAPVNLDPDYIADISSVPHYYCIASLQPYLGVTAFWLWIFVFIHFQARLSSTTVSSLSGGIY